MAKTKCEVCKSRYFDSDDQIRDFSDYTRDDFIVEAVIQPLARELRYPRIWEIVCIECLRSRIDRERNAVSGMTIDLAIED